VPAATVIVFCSLIVDDMRELIEVRRVGANAVVLRGHEDTGERLRAVVDRAIDDGIAADIMRKVRDVVPNQVQPIIECCVGHVREHPSVGAIARKLGKHRNTLAHRLATAGMPPLREVIAWSELLVASYLMDRTEKSVNAIARELAFPSKSAFRGALQRYTGLTPQGVRDCGGSSFLLETFIAHIAPGKAHQHTIPSDAPACHKGLAASRLRACADS
jgi:AraC-like DNA-binding protein